MKNMDIFQKPDAGVETWVVYNSGITIQLHER